MSRRLVRSFLLAVSPLFAASSALAASVTISQLYGGGGSPGAHWRNDYIELHNTTGAPINIGGWSVHYPAGLENLWGKTDIPAGTTIPAGGYVMVQGASSGSAGSLLPSACIVATNGPNLGTAAGKVLLSNNSFLMPNEACPTVSFIVDKVGYGAGTTCFEGSGPAGTPSVTTAALRSGGGNTDTNNNAADFTVGNPTPCNTQPTPATGSTWGRLKSLYR